MKLGGGGAAAGAGRMIASQLIQDYPASYTFISAIVIFAVFVVPVCPPPTAAPACSGSTWRHRLTVGTYLFPRGSRHPHAQHVTLGPTLLRSWQQAPRRSGPDGPSATSPLDLDGPPRLSGRRRHRDGLHTMISLAIRAGPPASAAASAAVIMARDWAAASWPARWYRTGRSRYVYGASTSARAADRVLPHLRVHGQTSDPGRAPPRVRSGTYVRALVTMFVIYVWLLPALGGRGMSRMGPPPRSGTRRANGGASDEPHRPARPAELAHSQTSSWWTG